MNVLLKFRCLIRAIFFSEGVLSVSRIYALYFISILLAKHDSESFLKYLLSPACCFLVFTKIAFSTYWQKNLIPHKPKMDVLRKTQHTYRVVTTQPIILDRSLQKGEKREITIIC